MQNLSNKGNYNQNEILWSCRMQYTHKNRFSILLNLTKFGSKWNSVWWWINRKSVITIQIWFDLTKFRKDLSLCKLWDLCEKLFCNFLLWCNIHFLFLDKNYLFSSLNLNSMTAPVLLSLDHSLIFPFHNVLSFSCILPSPVHALPDFLSVSSLASLPFLSCHRTTTRSPQNE